MVTTRCVAGVAVSRCHSCKVRVRAFGVATRHCCELKALGCHAAQRQLSIHQLRVLDYPHTESSKLRGVAVTHARGTHGVVEQPGFFTLCHDCLEMARSL